MSCGGVRCLGALHARAPRREVGAARSQSARVRRCSLGVGDLVVLQLAGVSCAPDGFHALLAPSGVVLPRAPNAVELLRNAAPPGDTPHPGARVLGVRVTAAPSDAFSPSSPRALTLLQLAQSPPCDLATVLPFSALADATATHESDEMLLGGVVLLSVAPFNATLLAGNEAGVSGAHAVSDAWLAVALALRYRAYGARLFASQELLERDGCELSRLRERFPQAVDSAYVRAQGAAVTRNLAAAALTAATREEDQDTP